VTVAETTAPARTAPALQEHSSQAPKLSSSAPGTSAKTSKTSSSSSSLPLSYSTGSATQVITVTAPSTNTSNATLQAWTKTAAGTWVKHGGSIGAHVGRDGLTNSMSEFVSETPMGSFTLTQAFGRLSNPGTSLPYFKTDAADWWISQNGPLYNTHQRCSPTCSGGLNPVAPSEHLYYEDPYYNYAVVIDYNTRNAGPVVKNAGSAVFLHVTDGGPTAGCVAIPVQELVSIMKWLTPSAHPRILIGLA
jgi:L,D-peptidoglycan transpeptidase YkuD (ErfK/YbiS/YcfS/YnhG family)